MQVFQKTRQSYVYIAMTKLSIKDRMRAKNKFKMKNKISIEN